MENIDEIALAEGTKTSSLMDFDNKYIWAISNININAARDLGLIGIKKHSKLASQIKNKVNGLYRDWISVLVAFVKLSQKTHNNKKVIKKMKIK